MTDVDILIAGGGVAGLTAAAVMGAQGFRVALVDPVPPVTSAEAPGADLRSTAFLQPARALLAAAGLWDRLAPFAMPLRVMRIVDAGGREPLPRVTADFDSSELGAEPFGWNFPNWLLRREMVARLAELPNVTVRAGLRFDGYLAREDCARVWLSDGSRLTTRLLIGADGRDSAVRRAAGIGVHRVRYGQKAIVFSVTHAMPHDSVSTEVHRSGGPFTLVPLADHDGQPASAVVWMDEGPAIAALAALPEPEFAAAATERAAGVLGPLALASPRQVWPIIAQVAQGLTAPRMALMAEAAHVIPPIGAQGLNMSLADLAALADLARARPGGLGDAAMLAAYARRRKADVLLRVAGVDGLNRAAMAEAQPLRDLRAVALRAMHGAAPLRRALMRLGLGAGRTPAAPREPGP